MSFLLYLCAFASLVCLGVFVKRPNFTPLKSNSKIQSICLYLGLFLLFITMASSSSSPDAQQAENSEQSKSSVAVGERPVGGVLKWKEVSKREVPMQNGRTRLMLTIAPLEDQSGAVQQDLLSTATGAAIRYQKETSFPVVIVNFASHDTENSPLLLAQAVYIPDGKGFDGQGENLPQWETLRAAKRGFTQAELEYLTLWAELFPAYQNRSGLDAETLDAAISERLALAPGTLKPFDNTLVDVEAE